MDGMGWDGMDEMDEMDGLEINVYIYIFTRIGMHVVSYAKSPPKFTDFGRQTDTNRLPSQPKILPKSIPGGVGSHWMVPSASQERQEASQERSRGAPGAPQGAPRAPRSAKKGAQEAPKAPQDGQDGRQVASKSPLKARKSIF